MKKDYLFDTTHFSEILDKNCIYLFNDLITYLTDNNLIDFKRCVGGESLLVYCMKRRVNTNSLKLLMEKGYGTIDRINNKPLLTLAIYFRNFEFFKYLVLYGKIDINLYYDNDIKSSSLYKAICYGGINYVKVLIDAGVDTSWIKDEIMKLIIEKIDKFIIHKKDNKGKYYDMTILSLNDHNINIMK